jgi:hypothetical protein
MYEVIPPGILRLALEAFVSQPILFLVSLALSLPIPAVPLPCPATKPGKPSSQEE